MNFTRTIFLLLIAGCSFGQNLKDSYSGAFKTGTALNHEIVSGLDKVSQNIALQHFNAITAENVMKAEVICPEPGVYNFTQADAFVDFGRKHNMFIIGHTLVWHNQTPDWFFKNADGSLKSKDEMKSVMKDYIRKVAGRYRGKVHAWDVVNEVIDDDGSYRPTLWVNGVGGGEELVKLAFRYASEFAPDAELYYNDFNAWRPEKVNGIVKMVKMLQAAGIKIDGVGMQGHWGLNYPKNAYIEEAIDAYAACGIKVMITELDIDVLPVTKEGQIIGQAFTHKQFQNDEFKEFLDPYRNGLPSDMSTKLASRYREVFEIFYKRRAKIDRVSLWGVKDEMSWKNDYPIPGRTNYPLLWNRDGSAKVALEEVLKIPE